jgi:hypothetical protein
VTLGLLNTDNNSMDNDTSLYTTGLRRLVTAPLLNFTPSDMDISVLPTMREMLMEKRYEALAADKEYQEETARRRANRHKMRKPACSDDVE